ncbi:hypothetical protein LTR95_015588, partial [Oleoguttula sp. CCFEE 5521]
MNKTILEPPGWANQQHEASGQSLFWALASIVLNAMLQPSFTGYLWSGDLFDNTLWPHRSSPFVCAIDALADVYIMVDKSCNPAQYSDKVEHVSPTILTTRLATFVIGVLPQAIKLFSSTGVPITQALAAVYLFATMTSMARTLYLGAPVADLKLLVEREEARPKEGNRRRRYSFDLIAPAGSISHLVALCYVWTKIFDVTHINTTSQDINNSIGWVVLSISLLWSTYALQHFLSYMAVQKFWIPRSPPFVLFGLFTPSTLHALTRHPLSRPKPKLARDLTDRNFGLFFHAAAVSYGLALLMEISAKTLLKHVSKARSPDSSLSGTGVRPTILPSTAEAPDSHGPLSPRSNGPVHVEQSATPDAEAGPTIAAQDVELDTGRRNQIVASSSNADTTVSASAENLDTASDDAYPFAPDGEEISLVHGNLPKLILKDIRDFTVMAVRIGTGRDPFTPLDDPHPLAPLDHEHAGELGDESGVSTIEDTSHVVISTPHAEERKLLARLTAMAHRTKWILMRTLFLLVWRFVLAGYGICNHPYSWVEAKLKRHSKDR